MTKTLTEQWREGTLPLGTYYILNTNGVEEIDKSVAIGELWNNTDLKEVLSPVPSYDKVKEMSQKIDKLKKQLEIAKKALEDILNDGDDYWDKDKANEALTKMSRLQNETD